MTSERTCWTCKMIRPIEEYVGRLGLTCRACLPALGKRRGMQPRRKNSASGAVQTEEEDADATIIAD